MEVARSAAHSFVQAFKRFAYRLYEGYLWTQIRRGPIPEHIGVVLDGNRRWARQRGLPAWLGHEAGVRKVEEFLQWCWQLGVRVVTLYAFSTENFGRSRTEVETIMRLAEQELAQLSKNPLLRKHRVRVRVIGRLKLLPEGLQNLARQIEEGTRLFDDYYLNIALAYGGRAEIADAVRKIALAVRSGELDPSSIDESIIERFLYTADLPKSDPDLIIRTSGEERLSNFLLWQAAYSELLFLDVYWPDFRKIDLWRAIRTYQSRIRRFGR